MTSGPGTAADRPPFHLGSALAAKQPVIIPFAGLASCLAAGAFGWLWGQAEEGHSCQLVLLQACCNKEGNPAVPAHTRAAGSGQICQTSCQINLRASLQGRLCVSSESIVCSCHCCSSRIAGSGTQMGVRQQGGDGGLVLIGLCVEKRLVLK